MADLPTPRATRLRTPSWLDGRLVAGILLVLVSVVAGAGIVGSADHYVRVYVARHALVPGQHVAAGDLEVGRARLYGHGGSYVAADGPAPTGYVVLRYVGAHELLPVAALARGGDGLDTRQVAVPVALGHLPSGLRHGDVVDVYLTTKTAQGVATPPSLVLAAAAVDAQDGGGRSFGGGGSTVTVVLSVPSARVADLVRAVQSGAIDLVRVPRDAVAGLAAPEAGATP